MRLRVDEDADALHLQLVDVPVEESEEVAPGVIVDCDKSNQVIGIEVLYLQRPHPVNFMNFQFETRPKKVASERLLKFGGSLPGPNSRLGGTYLLRYDFEPFQWR
jgi:uncharacterized protein YuzE